ncbi:MAG TPA: Crp/Fnr family transcriptional regulator [Puia sp.]|nr:Crp/Fnr family transcriptional regulator [Puia sp.]
MNVPVKYCASILSDDLNGYLLEYFRERFLPREAFLLKAGDVCHHLYFVESGLLRCFYYKDDKEISSRFIQQGEVGWSPQSFLRQQKGIEYIQALERSHIVTLSLDSIQCICHNFPLFTTVRQRITEDTLIADEQRMQAMWMQRSDEKLAWFTRRFPGLVDKVTAKYIASYLGITEVMLSRLRH